MKLKRMQKLLIDFYIKYLLLDSCKLHRKHRGVLFHSKAKDWIIIIPHRHFWLIADVKRYFRRFFQLDSFFGNSSVFFYLKVVNFECKVER